MSNDYIPFPPGAKRFFLRSDFPEEMCFPEYACCSAVRTKTLIAASKGLPLPNPFPDDLETDFESYERGRFYAYAGVGAKGTTLCYSTIIDGHTGMLVPEAGLFAAMLLHAEKAYGSPITKLLFPAIPAQPFKDWIVTNHVVLHDTVAESAAILHRSVAANYLKPRRAKS